MHSRCILQGCSTALNCQGAMPVGYLLFIVNATQCIWAR